MGNRDKLGAQITREGKAISWRFVLRVIGGADWVSLHISCSCLGRQCAGRRRLQTRHIVDSGRPLEQQLGDACSESQLPNKCDNKLGIRPAAVAVLCNTVWGSSPFFGF